MNTKVVKDVLVKLGVDPSEMEAALNKSLGSLKTWAVAGGAAVGAVAAAMTALTKASLDNIDVLAKQARAIGLTTDAFQKMTMVAAEAGVESGSLAQMLGFMQRAIDGLRQGVDAQVDSFAALNLSFADLQGLAPDEQFEKLAASLNSITDPAQRTTLAMEVFGRGGRDVINMLEDYSGKVREAEEFQARFGVTVSQLASDQVEAANDAVGRLSMVMEGLGNRMATAVAPAIERTANALIDFAAQVMGTKSSLDDFFGTLDAARDALGENVFNQLLEGGPAAVQEFGRELGTVQAEIEAFGLVVATIGPQLSIFADELEDLGETGAAAAMRQVRAEIEQARAALAAGTITGEEFRKKIRESLDAATAITSEFEAINGSAFSSAFANIDTLASKLWEAAKAAATAKANLPGAEWEMAPSDGTTVTGWEVTGAPASRPNNRGNQPLRDIDFDDGTGDGGGGGGANPFEARLEALNRHLMTEKELLAEDYAIRQETLIEAKEAELLTQVEFQEKSLALAAEYQEAMRAIDADAFAQKRAAWSGALGDLASLMQSGNKKLFEIGKIAALAQAGVDGYSAAVSAWDKGMKIGGPTVAATFAAFSLARTGAMIANIASQQFGGGGGGGGRGGGGGGGGGSEPSGAAGPSGVSNIIVQGDVIGRNTGDALVQEINKAIEAGHRINIEWQEPAGIM